MAIIRFTERPFFPNPWADFDKMRREMDRLSRTFMGEGSDFRGATVFPPLNITENQDNIYIRAEIPGVKSSDLNIAVEGETLTIQGERKSCAADPKVSYHRREIECGSFRRAITLPTRIKVDKVEARSVNGILTITLPKAEEVKPKQITVKVE